MPQPNTDPANGIRYGFCSGHPYPYLMDKIQERGRDITYENWKESTRSTLRALLADLDDEKGRTRDWWAGVLAAYGTKAAADVTDVASEAADLVDLASGTFDIEEVLDVLMRGACESCEIEGENWRYEYKGLVIELCTRNGPELSVLLSPYATRCQVCSPCVPNGGDLDNPSDDGIWTYCIPPSLADIPYPATLLTEIHD